METTNICALLFCDSEADARAELLFTPLLTLGCDTLRKSGIPQIAVVYRNCNEAALREIGAPLDAYLPADDPAAVSAFIAGRDTLLLPCTAVFTDDFSAEAWLPHFREMRDLFGEDSMRVTFATPETETAFAAEHCFAAVLSAKGTGEWLASGSAEFPWEMLETAADTLHLDEGCVCPAQDARSRHEAGEQLRQYILRRHLENGVMIPCTDGVMLAPDCQIGAGTQIFPCTLLQRSVVIGRDCEIGPNSVLAQCEIGDRVTVQSSVCAESVIGDDCSVGPFTRLRPGTRLGKEVRAGNFVEVKNADIGDGAKLSHLSYIGDAQVGEKVNIGCLCATANFDGKDKFRCEVGDGAFVGCNTILVAPVTLGEDAYTAAGAVITEDIPSGALAVARARQTTKEGWRKKADKYKK